MKWYFAINEESLHQPGRDFPGQLKVAVASARQHTPLRPHLLYDGRPNEHTAYLQRMGVTIVQHRFTLATEMRRSVGATYPVRVAQGAFMRTDIPDIETEEQFVLYTDCDVMFTPCFRVPELRPKYFACAPEHDFEDFDEFNTGVMVMNIPALRQGLPDFRRFMVQSFEQLRAFDQGAYQVFYKGLNSRLHQFLNWKPYWGFQGAAEVVHFHGPKPATLLNRMRPDAGPMERAWEIFWEINEDGCRRYAAAWGELRERADRAWA